MTQKDYIPLAEAFRFTRPRDECTARYDTWELIRSAIMNVLAADNVHFNAQKFLAATEF